MNFQISFIINDNDCLDFTLRTREQRHLYFGQVNTPLNHCGQAPKLVPPRSTWIWISIFSDNLSDSQAVLFQVYYNKTVSPETNYHSTANCFTYTFVFYRDYLPLHHSWSDLVLCALWTTLGLFFLNIFVTFTNFGLF